ncbi:MAG: hypothetical protein GY845_03105 [Planctomycetes bacterium]|nr:hypothetical protein [Planctomycetota bacterium]
MVLIPTLNAKTIKASSFDPLAIDCPPTDNIASADFAIVGEAPTSTEVLEGEPFIGPVGSQLNRICSAVRIARYQLYLTYACKAQLPKAGITKLWTEKGGRCAEWSELQLRLIDELSAFKGRIIILMGATAMKLLIDEPRFNAIGKYRGSFYKVEQFPHLREKLAGKILAISYHPAFTMPYSQPVHFYTMIADMQKILDLNADPSQLDMDITFMTRPKHQEIMQFLALALTKPHASFDIEAIPGHITCFAIAIYQNNKIFSMSVPLIDNHGPMWSLEDETKIWRALALILQAPTVGIICQNGMFDLVFMLRAMNIITDNFYFDTMIAQHICYTELPKGLDFLTSMYTYFPYYKDSGKSSHAAMIKDWDAYWLYNAKDAAYLFPITERLQEELTSFESTEAMEYMMDLHKPLIEMEWNGILTDQPGIKKHKAKLVRYINALQHGLNKLAGKDLNYNSSKQLIAYFYGICMIKPYINRKTKNASCDAVALSRIARKNVKGSIEAQMIMKLRTYGKLLSTYFEVDVDADSKLRCSHNITGTVSGRISTKSTFFGTGTNLQNQPYEFKKYLIAEIGRILCEFDLAKAEAHVVAFLTQDLNMIEAFESGIDVHSFNAAMIFDVPIEEVMEEARTKKVDQKKTMRYMGKKVVHASNYSMGPLTFSDNLAKENIFMTTSKCKQLLQAYVDRFPGLPRWHKIIEAEVQAYRVLYNLYNRPRRFLGIMNSALYRNAYSYIPQSTVAELLNKGTIKIANDPRLGRDGFDIDLLTTVHDSDVTQLWEKSTDELLQIFLIVQDHMSHTFIHKGRSFTIGLDAKIGYQWAGKTAEIAKFTHENINDALKKIGTQKG